MAIAAAAPLASPAESAPSQPVFVYVGLYDDDAPFVDYEGPGMVAKSVVTQPRPGDPYGFEVLVITLDPTREAYVIGQDVEKRLVVRLRGEMARSGEDGFRLRATIDGRVPVTVQLVRMRRKGDASGEEFPEFAFAVGRHDLEVEATVVGWVPR